VKSSSIYHGGSPISPWGGGGGGGAVTVVAGAGITVVRSGSQYTVSLYVPPSINSLTNNVGMVQVGNTVTAVTVNWTLGGSPITGQTLTDTTLALGDRTHAFTGLSLTTDKVYSLNVTDGITSVGASTAVLFGLNSFYGLTADAMPNFSDVSTGTAQLLHNTAGSKGLNTSFAGSATLYNFYAYPQAWGALTSFVVGGFATVWNLSTVTIINSNGHSDVYNVYTIPYPTGSTGNFSFVVS
jgi:hypothetical protein